MANRTSCPWKASFLVAGTCIGTGMLALPLVLSSFGLIFTFVFLTIVWLVMYLSSFLSLELNLQAKKAMALGPLAKYYGGNFAEIIGYASLLFLTYALMIVFIYGGGSVLHKLYGMKPFLGDLNFFSISLIVACLFGLVLLFPFRYVEKLNSYLFLFLIACIVIFIVSLSKGIDFASLPIWPSPKLSWSKFSLAVPVVFTSFGFQVIFHTLTDYCQKDPKKLKNAFFLGSLIAAVVYFLWAAIILSVVYASNKDLYASLAMGNIEVPQLMYFLGGISKWSFLQPLVWVLTFLAIFTSAIGVGIGLVTFLEQLKLHSNRYINKILCVMLTMLPALSFALVIPNAFVFMMGFAGAVLCIIAIILPSFLFFKARIKKNIFYELNNPFVLLFCLAFSFLVIFCEIFNFF